MDQKKDPDAATAFQRVLELDAENVIALKALSELGERAGALDDARRWLTRLLEVDPMNEEAQEALSKLPAAAVTPPPAPSAAAEAVAEPRTGADEAPLPPKVETLAGLETRAVEEEPKPAAPPPPPARESGKGFVIEKAQEALAGMETLEITPGAGEEPLPMADLESMEFTPPAEALAEPTEGLLDVSEPVAGAQPQPELEAPPEPEPASAEGGALPLIFPEGVSETAPPESGAGPDGALEPEPVVTETMAELYAKQGLLTEARDIYRQLVAQRPGDDGLAQRLAELEGVATWGAPRRTSGRIVASGGPTVRDFLGDVFSGRAGAPTEASDPEPAAPTPAAQGGRSDPETPSLMEEAFAESEPGEDVRGAPTRPAADEVSLASVFGEEPSPVSRPTGPAGSQPQENKFSFDEFFGGAPPKKAPTTRASQAELEKDAGGDEDDFKRWLKGLKS